MVVLVVKLPQGSKRLRESQPLMQAVENRMLSMVRHGSVPSNDVESIAERAAAYHLKTGGQRIRAQLAIHTGMALKLSAGDVVSMAAAAELVHNASLIHDDLQDRDLTRHGVATVWSAYGDGIAICAGDLLLSAAYCTLAGVSRPHLLPTLMSMLHQHVADASTGQCADLTNEKSHAFSLQDYENLAALKSGALLALPMTLALAASGELQAIAAARRAAELFAIGYQIFDDLKDVQKDASRRSAQPAINVVAVMQANSPGSDAVALAGELALKHLGAAAESSRLLPHRCGQRLHQLALDLRARISLAPG